MVGSDVDTQSASGKYASAARKMHSFVCDFPVIYAQKLLVCLSSNSSTSRPNESRAQSAHYHTQFLTY